VVEGHLHDYFEMSVACWLRKRKGSFSGGEVDLMRSVGQAGLACPVG